MPRRSPIPTWLRWGVVPVLGVILIATVGPHSTASPEPSITATTASGGTPELSDAESSPSLPLPPLPSPTTSTSVPPSDEPLPTTPPSPTPASSVPARPPADRVDRRWPKNPPWDACPAPVWPGETSTGSPGGGRRVLVVGDSLTRDSRRFTARSMRASGWTPTFRCWGSKRLDWGIAQVRRAKSMGQLPAYVVVALGTNDVSWETPATTLRRVQVLLDVIGPKRQVLWVDLDVDYSSYSRSRALWFNGMIRQVAGKHANVTVLPWRRVARGANAGRFDGIHYGSYGYRLRAKTVVAALDKLGRARPVPTPSATPMPTTPMPTPSVTSGPTPGVPGPTPSAAPTPTRTPSPTPTLTTAG